MQTYSNEFWHKHRGLVWSNPDADDAVFLRAALVRPRFGRLLDVALEFGLDRVQYEWEELQQDKSPQVERARPIVERILANIATGFLKADSGDTRYEVGENSAYNEGQTNVAPLRNWDEPDSIFYVQRH